MPEVNQSTNKQSNSQPYNAGAKPIDPKHDTALIVAAIDELGKRVERLEVLIANKAISMEDPKQNKPIVL